jgi:hypothetical protein
MVMEPADFRHDDHLPSLWELNRSRLWTVHRQRQMRTKPMIISKVAGEEALQMLRMEDHHMIETLPTDTPDEALHIRVLPRTLRCDHDFFDTHVLDALPKGHAVDTVSIAEEIAGRFIPGKRFHHLLRCPHGSWMVTAQVVQTRITQQLAPSDCLREAETEPLHPAGRLHMRR